MPEGERYSRDIEPGEEKKVVVEGYRTVFDSVPQGPDTIIELKEQLRPAVAKIADAWNVEELYNATREIIVSLPELVNEKEMRLALLELCGAKIPGMDLKEPPPEAMFIFTLLDRHVLMRLASFPLPYPEQET